MDQLLSSPQFVFCPFGCSWCCHFFLQSHNNQKLQMTTILQSGFAKWELFHHTKSRGCSNPGMVVAVTLSYSDLTVLQKTKVKPNRCSPCFIRFIYPSKLSQLSEAFEMWIGCQKPSFLHYHYNTLNPSVQICIFNVNPLFVHFILCFYFIVLHFSIMCFILL